MPICSICHKEFSLPLFTSDLSSYCSALCLQSSQDQLEDQLFDSHSIFGGVNPRPTPFTSLQISNVYRPFVPAHDYQFEPSTNQYVINIENEKIFTTRCVSLDINYDINQCPQKRFSFSSRDIITLGDLHGNTLTLLIILLQCGVIQFRSARTASTKYKILANIIQKESVLPFAQNFIFSMRDELIRLEDYSTFINIIDNDISISHNPPSIRLIGDILSDRMSSDQFTLALIGFLQRGYAEIQQNYNPPQLAQAQFGIDPKITILLSNHDDEFICSLTEHPNQDIKHFTAYAFPDLQLQFGSKIRFLDFVSILLSDPADRPSPVSPRPSSPLFSPARSRHVGGFTRFTNFELLSRIKMDLQAYGSCLVMFDSELAENTQRQCVRTIYSHASFHPRIALATMKTLAYDPRIDGCHKYPYESKCSFGDFTQNELLHLIKRTNLKIREICSGIIQNWCQCVEIGVPPTAFNVRDLNCLQYLQRFRSVNQAPENSEHSPSVYPTYPYLAIWLRVTECVSFPYDAAAVHDPFGLQKSPTFALPFLRNDTSSERTQMRNIHGHDIVTREKDISLDNIVGKGSWNRAQLNIATSLCQYESLKLRKKQSRNLFDSWRLPSGSREQLNPLQLSSSY